jgi:hypothetical protein
MVADFLDSRSQSFDLASPFFYHYARAREREMLSFVQLLILEGGKESPQFEATFLIAAKPAKHRIATGHFWIEANVAK